MTPALAILELSSIARGIAASDAVVKKAAVELVWSRPVSTGKHLLIFCGEVAEVEESYKAGRAAAAGHLVDELYLPWIDRQIPPLIRDPDGRRPPTEDAVAIVETTTVCAAVIAADAACKAAEVDLVDLRLAIGIGGKAYFTLTGELYAVEAAVEAAVALISTRLITTEIIPAPHADLGGGLTR